MSAGRMKVSLVLGFVAWLVATAQEHHGPHGGTLFCGPKHKYHAELTQNPAQKTVTVYILDHQAKRLVAIPAETIEMLIGEPAETIVLPAKSEKPSAPATTFELKHERFAQPLPLAKIKFHIKVDGRKPQVFELHD